MTFIPQMFDSGPTPKAEKAPTRDTAAESVNEQEAERMRRSLLGMTGVTSTMLSGPGGVTNELTGTRSMNR